MSTYLFNLLVIGAYSFSFLGMVASYWFAWDHPAWIIVTVLLVVNLGAMAYSGVEVRS